MYIATQVVSRVNAKAMQNSFTCRSSSLRKFVQLTEVTIGV